MINTLYTGDNLYILHGMNSESVDLVYLDPPFNSNRDYFAPVGSKASGVSFSDVWTWQDVNDAYLERIAEDYPDIVRLIEATGKIHSKAMMAYITYMTQRILELHRILKSTGSLYLHCDQTASHYLKLLLDEIFGRKNFGNEIIWSYRRWPAKTKNFQAMHDIILRYVKNKGENYWNPIYESLSDKTIKQHGEGKQNAIFDKNGNRIDSKSLEEKSPGAPMRDVWNIAVLNSQAKERVGYPTQKPLALLERIIKASSKPGDIILDPFCGCATTCVAAEHLGRKWIGIDIEEKAVEIVMERLKDAEGHLFSSFVNLRIPPVRTDVVIEVITSQNKADIKKRLFEEQAGVCKGCRAVFEIQHFEIDHIVPKAKGGGDYIENYQLLCSNCNRMKGDRPMDYLRMKIDARQKVMERIRFGE